MKEDYSLTRYKEYKCFRFNLDHEKLEDEIVLDKTYDYIKVELLQGINRRISIQLNGSEDDNYIILNEVLELNEIGINSIKAKVLEITTDYELEIQVILMR